MIAYFLFNFYYLLLTNCIYPHKHFITLIPYNMPSFIACPVCNKTGFLPGSKLEECPCCNAVVRRAYKIPPMIGQHGWTCASAVNAYYSRLAEQETKKSVVRQLVIYKNANPGASKNQIKERDRVLHGLYYPANRARYPTLEE